MRFHRAGLAFAVVTACTSGSGGAAPSASSPAMATGAPADSALESLRRQVANGSIVADVQLGRNPPMAVGACLDPVAAARFELDRSLELVPDHPPVLVGALPIPPLPESLRDAEARTGVVVARWVVDTTGRAIPASVTIVSSPHGLMSVQTCGAIFAARFTPAHDDGRVVRARVEMPVRFVP
jgi:Gram-negative bacterial tonB protein.